MDARPAKPAPSLRCPRCKNPFKMPLDKVGLKARCKSCDCNFRVVMTKDGGFDVRVLDSAAAQAETAEYKPRRQARDEEDDRTVMGKAVRSRGRSRADEDTFNGTPVRRQRTASGRPPRQEEESGSGRWLLILLLILVLGGLGGGGYWYFVLRDKGKATDSAASLGKYGGIEIGSTGVKMLGVEYYQTDDGAKYKLLFEPNDYNTGIGDVQPGASSFEERNFERTVNQVGDYFKTLKDKGVPTENIYVACSSGVLSPFTVESIRKQNQDKLLKAIKDKTGKEPDFIDPRAEAKYEFQAIVPKSDWAAAVLIDIGGNNIKGGGFDKRGNFLDFSVNAGVSSFEKKVTAAKGPAEPFASAAQRLVPVEIEAPLRKDLAAVDELTKRKKVYFLGGISWALATYTRPAEFYADAGSDKPSYRKPIKYDDFREFDTMVSFKSPTELKGEVEKKIGSASGADVAKENLEKIQNEVFKKSDRLTGGAKILMTLAGEFKLKESDKEIQGFRYGHMAWLLGYVGDKSGQIK